MQPSHNKVSSPLGPKRIKASAAARRDWHIVAPNKETGASYGPAPAYSRGSLAGRGSYNLYFFLIVYVFIAVLGECGSAMTGFGSKCSFAPPSGILHLLVAAHPAAVHGLHHLPVHGRIHRAGPKTGEPPQISDDTSSHTHLSDLIRIKNWGNPKKPKKLKITIFPNCGRRGTEVN